MVESCIACHAGAGRVEALVAFWVAGVAPFEVGEIIILARLALLLGSADRAPFEAGLAHIQIAGQVGPHCAASTRVGAAALQAVADRAGIAAEVGIQVVGDLAFGAVVEPIAGSAVGRALQAGLVVGGQVVAHPAAQAGEGILVDFACDAVDGLFVALNAGIVVEVGVEGAICAVVARSSAGGAGLGAGRARPRRRHVEAIRTGNTSCQVAAVIAVGQTGLAGPIRGHCEFGQALAASTRTRARETVSWASRAGSSGGQKVGREALGADSIDSTVLAVDGALQALVGVWLKDILGAAGGAGSADTGRAKWLITRVLKNA